MKLDDLDTDPKLLDLMTEWGGPGWSNIVRMYHAMYRRVGYDEIIGSFGPGGQYEVSWSGLALDQELADIRWYLEDPSDDRFYRLNDPSHTPYTADTATGYDVPRQNIANGAWGRVYTAVATQGEEFLSLYATHLQADRSESGNRIETVDWSGVQELNQRILKDLDEGQTSSFWQAGRFVVLGDSNSEPARRAVEQQRGVDANGSSPNGTVTMVSKGGFTSPGSIRVQGAYESAEFEAAVREFSKKEIEFG